MRPLKQQTYEDLRYRIITHDLKPGQQLKDGVLMAHYNIGRTPLREVMLALQHDALIHRVPRSGTFVAPLDVHLFKQVVEIRVPLEAFAAQLAARRIDEKALAHLAQLFERVKTAASSDAEDLDVLTRCEFDFHQTLGRATHNAKLQDMLHELHGISARFWHYLVFSREELLEQFDDLDRVYQAVADRDAVRARERMTRHIQHFVDKVRDKII